MCLSSLFDRAFDRGVITFDTDLCVVVSRRLIDAAESADLGCSLDESRSGRDVGPTHSSEALI